MRRLLRGSLILGIAAAVGGVVPLVRDHPDKIFSPGGLGVLAGLALVVIGVAICAVAGRRREKALGLGPQAGKASIGMGLLYCLFSGLGSALVGIGLESGKALVDASVALHGNPLWAPMVAWLERNPGLGRFVAGGSRAIRPRPRLPLAGADARPVVEGDR